MHFRGKTVIVLQWNLYKPDTIGAIKKCSLCRAVCFVEIFSKIVRPQSKAIYSLSYRPSYRGVRFIEIPPVLEFSCVFVAFEFSEVFTTVFKICFPSPIFELSSSLLFLIVSMSLFLLAHWFWSV